MKNYSKKHQRIFFKNEDLEFRQRKFRMNFAGKVSITYFILSWNWKLEAQEEQLRVGEPLVCSNKQTHHHVWFSAVYFSAKTVPGVCNGTHSTCQIFVESLQRTPHYTATSFPYRQCSDRKVLIDLARVFHHVPVGNHTLTKFLQKIVVFHARKSRKWRVICCRDLFLWSFLVPFRLLAPSQSSNWSR